MECLRCDQQMYSVIGSDMMMCSTTAYEQLAKKTHNMKWKTAIVCGLTYDELESWMMIHGFRTDTPKSTIHRWINVWRNIGWIFEFRDEHEKRSFIWFNVPVETACAANQQANKKKLNPIYNPKTGEIIESMFMGVLDQ